MKKKVEKIKEKISSIKLSLFKGIYKENLGKFKSNFKGNGLQFKDHRSYVYGDDIRGINWSLLAKNGSPYVKEHEEERNVNLTVILDVSSSMLYGLNKVSKLDVCIELVCLLYLVAQETNDWVSVFFVGGKAESLGKGRGEEGFFKFLILVLRNFEFLLDGSWMNRPKKLFEILIRVFFSTSNNGLNNFILPFKTLKGLMEDRPVNPLPLDNLIKNVST